MIIFLLKEWKTGKNIIQSQKTSMTQKLGRETTSEMSDTILENEMQRDMEAQGKLVLQNKDNQVIE